MPVSKIIFDPDWPENMRWPYNMRRVTGNEKDVTIQCDDRPSNSNVDGVSEPGRMASFLKDV